MSDKDVEVELKLVLSPKSLEEVFNALKGKADEKGVLLKERPRSYYDTIDLDLLKKDSCIRVQYKEGKGYEQTIKLAIDDEDLGEGVLARYEWKDLIPENKPDISKIENKTARALFNDIAQDDLHHIFTSDVKRRFFAMPVKDKGNIIGIVEMAFDLGAVKLAPPYKDETRISEIEIEMKSGDAAAIDKVVRKIQKIAPEAKISVESKLAMGCKTYANAVQAHAKKLKNTKIR